MRTSRGIRNNNPGNIDFNPRNKWQGQTGIETGVANPRFATFDKPENGIRALAKLLRNYQKLHKLNTVREIINRWAPPVENATTAYVKACARALGVDQNEVIDLSDRRLLKALTIAVIRHENGLQPYSDFIIDTGIAGALQ